MARILYGIHGTGHGHAMRGLTLARALPQHEFLFIANDDAPKVLEPEFRTARLPNLGTVFKNYRVDLSATIKKALPILWRRRQYIDECLKIIEDFKPDVCMSDLEYFVPEAAKKCGLPCLSLDHQHIITCCEHHLPANMLWDAFLQGLTPKWLFRPGDAAVIISFYSPNVLPQYNALVAPPILRRKVTNLKPGDEGHILVYQSNSTDKRLIDFLLSCTDRKAYVFGYEQTEGRKKNVRFMPKSEDRFLELLAGASYVIQGGSHTLMSESLYLGKPVISIPIKAMLEQRFNAFYLEKLGYGRNIDMQGLNKTFLEDFESSLPAYRENIGKQNFYGNELVFGIVDNFAKTGALPLEKSAVQSEHYN